MILQAAKWIVDICFDVWFSSQKKFIITCSIMKCKAVKQWGEWMYSYIWL